MKAQHQNATEKEKLNELSYVHNVGKYRTLELQSRPS